MPGLQGFAGDSPMATPAVNSPPQAVIRNVSAASPEQSNSNGPSADTGDGQPDNPRKESWKWNFFRKK
jgi:hypothetical protein